VVDRWIAPFASQKMVEHVAAALASRSNHPIAKAVSDAIIVDAGLVGLHDLREHPGRGVKARCPALRCEVLLGSQRFIAEAGCDATAWRQSNEYETWNQRSLAYVAIGDRLAAVFALDEQLRPEGAEAIRSLRELGLEVRLMTGDRKARAAHLAAQLGIEYEAELLPDAKLRRIRALQQHFGPLVMVGDGLNDAPALATADVGIALGCGADLSRDAAEVCLLSNRLDRIPWAILLARQTTGTLRWNLVWAFGYNLAAVPLAAVGLVNPIIAALAMAASSLLVVVNSLKLAASPVDQRSLPDNEQSSTPSRTGRVPMLRA
jgi:P-type E1-E2 ATPase